MKTTRVLISIALLSSAFTSALFAQASAAADTTTVATDTTAESTAASTEAAVTATMSASTDTTTTSASTDTATASAAATDTATADDKKDEKKVSSSKAGVSVVPAAKRPVKPTAEQLSEAEVSDPGSYEKNSETLKFGLESDITDLLETLTKNKDVRFADDIYDLFESTKSASVRESVLGYFTELKDPCLEDYAVTILNDPYDEKKSTVDAVFRYVQTMKTKAAVPAVLTLLESENQDYFDGALETLGDIGGTEEAVYLTEYLDRGDLSTSQKQSLVKVLGQLKAVETYDRLEELAKDKDENVFIRMYSAEAIGAMGKEKAVPVLVKLYEDNDPNMRTYVIKGISNFNSKEAQNVIVQALKDSYYKVRLEAINAVKEQTITDAIPYLVYRAKNDPETVVKNACYPVIAKLNTKEGNDFLVGMITDQKTGDIPKSKVASALLAENHAGTNEILSLAKETLKDDRRKPLRYALGKEMAKYSRPEFSKICREYIASSDASTQGTGLDMYARGKYADVSNDVHELADYYKTPNTAAPGKTPLPKKRNVNAEKAARILGIKITEEEIEAATTAPKPVPAVKKTTASSAAASSSSDAK